MVAELMEEWRRAERELACEECGNRGFVWITVAGFSEKDECPACHGAKRNTATIELLQRLARALGEKG